MNCSEPPREVRTSVMRRFDSGLRLQPKCRLEACLTACFHLKQPPYATPGMFIAHRILVIGGVESSRYPGKWPRSR